MSGEVDMRRLGRKSGSSDAGPRSRSQANSGCTCLFLPLLPGPGGPPTPAHWQGAHADAPFSVFCRFGSASSCGEGKSWGSCQMGEGPPPVRPCSVPSHAPQGSGSKSKGLPAPAASLTAPQAPQPSPNLLFSSSLQRGPFVVIIFFFLI